MAFLNPTVPIWLEINNDEYKTCIEEELVKQNFCVQKCPADEDCLSNCFESFLETTRKCPCMAGCPNDICPVETTAATTTDQSTTSSFPIEENFLFVLAENVYSGAPKLNHIITSSQCLFFSVIRLGGPLFTIRAKQH
jgi:hypothetical protein